MNPTTWAQPNLGQTHLNPDPPHGIDGQCVNAASSWSLYQGGPELMGATAYSIWLNFRHPFYQVIPNTSPQTGDIVFFAPNNANIGTGPAGHVSVCIKPGFTSADADWGGFPLKYVNHTMSGILGVFRKVTHEEVPMPNEGDVQNAYHTANNRDATADEVKIYTSKPWSAPDSLYYGKVLVDLKNAQNSTTPPNTTTLSSGLYKVN